MKNTIAALLMITLSGAYCLFCSQEIIAAASKAAHHSASKTSQTEHCNFSKNKTSEAAQTASSVNGFERCSLRLNFFVAKLEKQEFPKQTPVLANSFFSFPESVKLETGALFTEVFYRAPVRENRDLHIKNCVFRI